METCKGLTIVPHEELSRAVSNWHKARVVWKTYQDNKEKQREINWQSIPIVKRFWYKLKSGIFIPEEYWTCANDWSKVNFPEELKGRLYQYVGHNDGWWSTKRFAAEDCCKHSTQTGVHYLNPEQVEFVSKFKDLY